MRDDAIVSDNNQTQWDDVDKICIVTVARRVAGEEAAGLIQGHFGGTTFYIPTNMPRDHQLSCLIGWEAARKIANEIGGVTSLVARGLFRPDLVVREIVHWGRLAGLSNKVIARLAGISDRHAIHVARSLREAGTIPSKPRINRYG